MRLKDVEPLLRESHGLLDDLRADLRRLETLHNQHTAAGYAEALDQSETLCRNVAELRTGFYKLHAFYEAQLRKKAS